MREGRRCVFPRPCRPRAPLAKRSHTFLHPQSASPSARIRSPARQPCAPPFPKRHLLPSKTYGFAARNHTFRAPKPYVLPTRPSPPRAQGRSHRPPEAAAPPPSLRGGGRQGNGFPQGRPDETGISPSFYGARRHAPRSPPRAPSDGFRFVGKGRGRAFFLSFCGDFGWRFASLFRRVRTQLVDLCQKSSGKGNFPRILFSKRRKRTYLCNCNLGLFRFIQHNCL